MRASSLVPSQIGPVSLVCYLTRRFTYLSKEEWLERIREGRIFLNGTVAIDSSVTLSRGDTVAYDLPHFDEPPADLSYSIVYEDEWILGINKSGNCLVHKSGRSFRSNLIYQLRYCHLPSPYPCVNAVHRLDRETSGVVLFAKDKDIVRKINDAFGKRTIRKEYLAVVKGIPPEPVWTVQLPIGRDEEAGGRCKFRIDHDKGKIAETYFETIRTLNNNCAFLRARPITGRTHQIRVHLAAYQMALIGDKVYELSGRNSAHGQNIDDPFSSEHFHRQALHCASIGFEHPKTKKSIVIEAPLPPDINTLLRALT
jgi:23S rRNA pseudouridine1911/1915/1917 synthase